MARYEECELTNMCMVRTSEERYLVVDRRDPGWPGIVFPGGHVERGESITDSVIREVREETGVTVIAPRLCGVKQFTSGEGRRYLVFFYRANGYSGELRSSPEGEAMWLTMEEIRARRTVDGFCDMLRLFEDDSVSELYYPPAAAVPELR